MALRSPMSANVASSSSSSSTAVASTNPNTPRPLADVLSLSSMSLTNTPYTGAAKVITFSHQTVVTGRNLTLRLMKNEPAPVTTQTADPAEDSGEESDGEDADVEDDAEEDGEETDSEDGGDTDVDVEDAASEGAAEDADDGDAEAEADVEDRLAEAVEDDESDGDDEDKENQWEQVASIYDQDEDAAWSSAAGGAPWPAEVPTQPASPVPTEIAEDIVDDAGPPPLDDGELAMSKLSAQGQQDIECVLEHYPTEPGPAFDLAQVDGPAQPDNALGLYTPVAGPSEMLVLSPDHPAPPVSTLEVYAPVTGPREILVLSPQYPVQALSALGLNTPMAGPSEMPMLTPPRQISALPVSALGLPVSGMPRRKWALVECASSTAAHMAWKRRRDARVGGKSHAVKPRSVWRREERSASPMSQIQMQAREFYCRKQARGKRARMHQRRCARASGGCVLEEDVPMADAWAEQAASIARHVRYLRESTRMHAPPAAPRRARNGCERTRTPAPRAVPYPRSKATSPPAPAPAMRFSSAAPAPYAPTGGATRQKQRFVDRRLARRERRAAQPRLPPIQRPALAKQLERRARREGDAWWCAGRALVLWGVPPRALGAIWAGGSG
ncbi:hypothetical protein CERSUDRAFT_99579 [Gelatoporia subvermispora B]|uniref:Uncharacterized protein n=1 Tax=Ceriporiopsis subvermispora (strain B) TaxID=914234 RepID=M2R1P6_CERS8|nr:hypothetical protein CERSUDRAFT_99579 [Gelatoporia subvermispora B]